MSNHQPQSSPYLNDAQHCMGRVISSMSREDGYKKTLGSFDRTWWCWKFSDFSAARFQEGIYTLCWMAYHRDAANCDKDHLLKLICDGLKFWKSLQHKNGAFDEAYPNEYSLAATAFTTFYIGEGFALIKSDLPTSVYQKTLDTIVKAADWLANNGEYHGVLSNHLAAAASALHVTYRLTKDEKYAKARDRYIAQITMHQDENEGWMMEYGGADPGYQSHGLFYLSRIYATADPATKRRMHNMLEKALSFQKWFLHPDGSFGGEYASRGTCFAFPAAFEILACEFADADIIARNMQDMITQQKAIGPLDMDRWNLFPMLNNYLFAHDAACGNNYRKDGKLPWQTSKDFIQHFKKAGIILHKKDRVLSVISDLGGTIKQWDTKNSTLLYSDCGYITARRKKVYSSQNRAYEFSIDADNNRIKLETYYTSLPQVVMSPWRFIAFRGFTLTCGRFPRIAKTVKNILVNTLIKNKKKCSIHLSRQIDLNSTLSIKDEITNLHPSDKIIAVAHHVGVHMGSARYAGRHFTLLAPIEKPTLSADKKSATRHFAANTKIEQKQEAA